MVETNLPILFLKDVVLLPYNELRIEITSETDKRIIAISERRHESNILLVNLMDSLDEKPNVRKLPKVAILGKIKTKLELSNNVVRIIVAGIDRVEVLNYITNEDKTYEAFVIPTKEYDYSETEANALKRILYKDINDYLEVSTTISNNVLGRINGINSIGRLSDIIVSELSLDYQEKYKYIETVNPMNRIKLIIEDLNREMETVKLENMLEEKLKEKLDEEQKNYILKEKIKLMKEEINETDIKESDLDCLNEKINKISFPKHISDRLKEELKRYELTSVSSPEISIIRNYIDWIINIPWNKTTKDNNDILDIKTKLDNTHFGLDNVKDRIIEYIAVSKKRKNDPILCLIGPPGVGKTTLARSIASALNRKFVKISVGGIHDEGEIIGHRRTYIGANPGKIIQGIKKAQVSNPVFLIDEIDKLTKDYKGDPSSALLDILDKEQNSHFCDNYIEEEFDLSKVMFILTGNDETMIPEALRDRLEIIKLPSYTTLEKESIAKNYIIPKLAKEYETEITLSNSNIKEIILNYTRESGVRELERMIDTIYRKVLVNGGMEKKFHLVDYLGLPKYKYLYNEKINSIGEINTLGYSPLGGFLLKTTSVMFSGTGKITLTGMLGEVLKESAYIALNYIRSNNNILEIDDRIFLTHDFHIHFESGAIPKDGPSAGVSLITSLISLIKKKTIDSSISMTGEITLRGKILPVGNIKEKILTAINNNIKTIYVPIDNKDEVKEMPIEIIKLIKVKYVNNFLDIYNDLF
ncbi:MAG: endopeptidase La [Bacilli bacterium]|nr:endopeptidase La [Bacilli bacterium]